MKIQDFVDLVTDCSRRDFTINAMAIDMETADLIDPFGGFKDLKAKTLRHVGPAFREDPLRVIRLARFLAKLDGFTVVNETFALAQEMVRGGELNELPWERFAAEVVKVLETCGPDGCFTFFDALDKLECSQHVTFFAGMDLLRTARAAKLVARVVPAARATLLGAVAFTDPERAEHVGGSVARDVCRALSGLRGQVATPELLYETLKRTGAWSGSPTFQVLLSSLRTLHALGEAYPFYDGQLVHAEVVTTCHAQLGAELAQQGVDGAAIGRAIRDARMRSLRQLDL
jgi:tRNA nucleotidyltransferase (CCA-adding enzyme)